MFKDKKDKKKKDVQFKKLRTRKKVRTIAGVVIFGIFAVIGSVMLFFMSIQPLVKVVNARDWSEVSCKIISAEVESHDGSESTTYSIEIVYSYKIDGITYENDKYDFMFGGSSSGYDRKAKVVRYYRYAKNPVCFVDPDNHSEAVLNREVHLGFLWGLFPIPFLGAGVAGLWWIIRKKIKDGQKEKSWLPELKRKQPAMNSSFYPSSPEAVVIKTKSPWIFFVSSTAFTLLWDGIVLLFLFKIMDAWGKSSFFSSFGTVMFVPFAIVGVALWGLVVFAFLGLFNPRLRFILNDRKVLLGGNLQLGWDFKGRTEKIKVFRIFLKGVEKIRYQSGSDTVVDDNVFFEKKIYVAQDQAEIVSGTIDFTVPADLMHSFVGENNKIVWEVEVEGVIDRWPDINEKVEFVVIPAEMK